MLYSSKIVIKYRVNAKLCPNIWS